MHEFLTQWDVDVPNPHVVQCELQLHSMYLKIKRQGTYKDPN